MFRIAVLLTCYNRKDKTISCLVSLMSAFKPHRKKYSIKVYLTDDGSTDGTGDEVKKLFPDIHLLKGDGTLYWSGGMINSWQEAKKNDYDAYLLLNDDTKISLNLFDEIFSTHEFSLMHYGSGGIYIGSVKDESTGQITYGGSVISSKFLYMHNKLIPNGIVQPCELGNANIMLVSKDVVARIGILSKRYMHAVADYDYTLTAIKNHLPVLLMSAYCGTCSYDHNKYHDFIKLPLMERMGFLFSPLGFAFKDQLKYMFKFFPYRIPFVFVSGWFKVLFPGIYLWLNEFREGK